MPTGYVCNNTNYTNQDLSSIFPAYEAFRVFVSTTALNSTNTITLTKNSENSTTYTVLVTLENGTNGAAYSIDEASQNVNTIFVDNKTASSFRVILTKPSGPLFEGYVNVLVIY